MAFDIDRYEQAIMTQDHTQQIKAGLELAEAVSTLSPQQLEQFSQPIVDLLLEALRGTDWEYRNLISNALALLGKKDFVAKSTWFWKKLISTYTDADAGLRSTAMDLLKELGRSEYSLEVLEPLIEGLRHSEKDMRILSANTLGRIRPKEVVPMLIQAVQDDNPNVVYNVVECLGDIGDRRAVPTLMHLLREPPDEWVHVATLEALGKIGDQRAVDMLLSLVSKEFVADPLINALGLLGDSRAIPTLVNYLKDEDRDIRELAIKALVTIREEVEDVAMFTGVHYELNITRTILKHSLTGYMKNLVSKEMQDQTRPQELREHCAVLLSSVEYQKALAPIVRLLEEYPLSKRIIDALSRYKKRALSPLLPLLDHADFQVRQSVGLYLQALVQQGDSSNAQIKRALLHLTNDENPLIAQIALETVGAVQNTSILPSLLKLLQTNPQAFGDTVAEILAQFPKRSVLHAVMPRLEEHDDTLLPYYLKILGYAGARLETFKTFFKHANPQIQHASILAVGCTGNPEGIPLLLPFIMSRQHSETRCIATRSLQHLITALGPKLPKPKNIFDALFVMLNTYKNEEELSSVAQTLGTLCSYPYQEITEVNVAVVRGRLLDLLPGVSTTTQASMLHALQGIIDISSYPVIRALRRTNSLEVQKIVALLYGQFPKDLRVIADVSDMISHSEFSIRKFWILTAGKLCAIELTDMLVPLLADPNFRNEAFQALTMMGADILPRLGGWLNHEDPRIQKMTALVVARISQDRIDIFCPVPQA